MYKDNRNSALAAVIRFLSDCGNGLIKALFRVENKIASNIESGKCIYQTNIKVRQ